MTFPTHQQASEVLQPREEPLDLPPTFVTPEFSPILAVPSCAITTMGGDQLDSVLLGKPIDHCVAVISLIANQSFRLVGHEAVLERSLDELLLMRRSARNPEGDRKTMAVCDCHELAPFADERSTNAIAPFFAPMVVVPRTRSTSVTAGCIVPTLRKPRRMGHPQLGYREETKTEGQATRLQPLPRRAT
jgi:hypothetical protein